MSCALSSPFYSLKKKKKQTSGKIHMKVDILVWRGGILISIQPCLQISPILHLTIITSKALTTLSQSQDTENKGHLILMLFLILENIFQLAQSHLAICGSKGRAVWFIPFFYLSFPFFSPFIVFFPFPFSVAHNRDILVCLKQWG